MRFFVRLFVFLFLTVVTQIGGVLYLIWLFVLRRLAVSRTISTLGFVAFYSAISFFLIPPLAKTVSNRVPLPCTGDGNLQSQSLIYCMLNRHYVKPQLLHATRQMANAIAANFPDTTTLTLDANFPFLDGFPLLPHLSHDDGKKLDIAFKYTDQEGNYMRGKTPSPIGYWHFSRHHAGEISANCPPKWLSLRWDMHWFQPFNDHTLKLEPKRTAYAIQFLIQNSDTLGLEKVLLEPHLKQRFWVKSDRVRFQGCRAARHDDHFHFQIKLR